MICDLAARFSIEECSLSARAFFNNKSAATRARDLPRLTIFLRYRMPRAAIGVEGFSPCASKMPYGDHEIFFLSRLSKSKTYFLLRRLSR